jgi:uncharacterized protein (TIGR02271 family)
MIHEGSVKEGMTVISADGEKLGKIKKCGAEAFFIEKGFFFPKEYEASYAEVERIEGDRVFLGQAAGYYGGAGSQEVREAGEVRIPLAEEKVAVKKRAEEVGEVRVTKEVVTEQQHITTPVTREYVRVEHVPAERTAPAGEGAFKEESISIPVSEERVEVTKTPVVREEVVISKGATEEQETVEVETQRETVRVEDEPPAPRKPKAA